MIKKFQVIDFSSCMEKSFFIASKNIHFRCECDGKFFFHRRDNMSRQLKNFLSFCAAEVDQHQRLHRMNAHLIYFFSLPPTPLDQPSRWHLNSLICSRIVRYLGELFFQFHEALLGEFGVLKETSCVAGHIEVW